MEKILELKQITKKFGGVVALDKVDFELYENEIVGLVGDNGAGKSTLIKIISGVYSPDSGEIYFEGKKVEIHSPKDAIELGIETIYQDLALFDNLSASSNIFAGREIIAGGLGKIFGWLNQGKMDKEAKLLVENFGIEIPNPKEEVRKLSGGQRQSVAISRSIKWGKKILIMDEPTAALGVKESGKLLDLIKNLINKVRGMIVISHNIEHIIGIADRAIVLRKGQRAGSVQISNRSDSNNLHRELVAMITGLKP
ncbi:MAG: ATP-binding cassette domain-containing protein [Actinobacteria bacterium]|nr:ATP-binding cassette domain-containing protein [Actinomycetota bacterium]